MATALVRSSCRHLHFTKPRYNGGLVLNASFADEAEE